ncbi:MAG: AbrB/MazE/SpoVT family DNA-binding domain-containing protein [Armatimonadota bacterium]|nr:AbrB/MazE/SpoVT family DNA-binding domain-containing protein [Armatimonadota bacterium]MDR7465026.1 AbrB/MazE/SpoVT family DNA-binding domain-containing protein [Armatimonadota bacterium]MDR7470766.1 AbrB/MazE/SpoVT family DNA-binding domain-containing protein [Armatimonadota bacterium]MDR7475321.1 AbrB/MazE/SpoVT family DNA-binding domain-containing protein [Armatimonadota bacterium]MDR7539946.1 AbrB/MazE/SpoVT family DNA-binding domain-containing protein [Armatimonadota bacterium]
MTLASLSVKGQLVIPKKIRKALGLRPGMRLVMEVEGDRIVVRPAPAGRAGELYGRYRGVPLLADLAAEHEREAARGR